MEERRDEGDIVLPGLMSATVAVDLPERSVELHGTVVRATARTVVVELDSGAGTLALAVTPRCLLTLEGGGVVVRADVRPGNRVDDVPDSRQIELVILDDTFDLGAALS